MSDVPGWVEKMVECPNCDHSMPIKSEHVEINGRSVDFDCPKCKAHTSFRKAIAEVDL